MQFHDILPGSSIAWVHREARETYARVGAELERSIGTALAALAGDGDGSVAVQRLAVRRRRRAGAGRGHAAAAAAERRPRCAARPATHPARTALRVERRRRGPGLSRCSTWSPAARCWPGPANLLQLHPDTPNRFDAWDVDPFYRARRHRRPDDVESLDRTGRWTDGTAEVHVVRRCGAVDGSSSGCASRPGSRRLEIETDVDWQHDETLLKVAFPLAVHAERSTSEIGYGHVHRADAHEHPLGRRPVRDLRAPVDPRRRAGLRRRAGELHDVRPRRLPAPDRRSTGRGPTTVRLTLARSPRFPDPDTDRGVHRFRYALVARRRHPARRRGGLPRSNLPLRTVTGSSPCEPGGRGAARGRRWSRP